jgi:hypothetical protein
LKLFSIYILYSQEKNYFLNVELEALKYLLVGCLHYAAGSPFIFIKTTVKIYNIRNNIFLILIIFFFKFMNYFINNINYNNNNIYNTNNTIFYMNI